MAAINDNDFEDSVSQENEQIETAENAEEQHSDPDSALVSTLLTMAKKQPKLVRSSVYNVNVPWKDGNEELKIRSWKMNEFKYYDVPSPFPTLARGLFTREVMPDEEAAGHKKYQVVVRGYDKFFNIGEVPWVNWDDLEKHTTAPYTLSLKSNGCIIFIAPLTPTSLLVTSKHSLGATDAADKEGKPSHAQAGETWLRKYLKEKGKTEADLAKRLWDEDWTAVAELCDDSFEEHVLAYPPHLTGLHLHGLNSRSATRFQTEPHEKVDAFAAEWGFIKTKSIKMNTIAEVRKFTTECAERGEWEGEAVEGFVVRTTVADAPDAVHTGEPGQAVVAPLLGKTGSGMSRKNRDSSAPPYPPGSSFFFKVKFDEPYMMYRDWREATKKLLSAAGKDATASGKANKSLSISADILPKNKMKRPETKLYVDWVIKEMKRDLKQFDGYTKGKGIIATREMFLDWLKENGNELEKVQAEHAADAAEDNGKEKEFQKTIIVPVAIPGCGKTAVSIALTQIMKTPAYQAQLKDKAPGGKVFKWGHTQSDDVHVKKAGPAFVKNVMSLVGECDVVIADKNNHLIQHRAALREAVDKLGSADFSAKKSKKKGKKSKSGSDDEADLPTPAPNVNVRLLGLDWGVLEHPLAMVHRVCADRVLSRGQNHQALRAGKKIVEGEALEQQEREQEEADNAYEEVLWQFITAAEPLTPSEVDVVVDMEVEESMENAVRRALKGCLKVLYGVKESEVEALMPSQEVIQQGVDVAMAYKPTVFKPDEKKEKKDTSARYFGMLPEVDLEQIIDSRLAAADAKNNPTAEVINKFWTHLKSTKRVAKRPHITIVHRNTLSDPEAQLDHELWERCGALQQLGRPPMFKGKLGSLICDGRVLALTFENFDVDSDASVTASSGQEGPEFSSKLPHYVRDRLHITVGTKEQSIPGVEAKGVVEKFRRHELDGLSVLGMKVDEDMWVRGRIKPLNN
ncbi:hypothetical protein D9613_008917 [Agrocybe pediades]|uniref:tRNA ligase n=1 Tax=Agrocybe pediades TaxID=84607 RepID=A0A8H4QUC8_9AGAR|nr:hypothetical protein D9613_008917 [Agrocybe pediades]